MKCRRNDKFDTQYRNTCEFLITSSFLYFFFAFIVYLLNETK